MNIMDARPPKARPEITVDIVIFTVEDGLLKVLLTRRQRQPFINQLALPGGFLWENETTLQAAKRILKEKVNVGQVFFEQLYTFDDPRRDSRGHVITVAHFALVPAAKLSKNRLAENASLETVAEAKSLPFDHGKILNHAASRLRNKLAYSNIAYSLLPELFTLSQLQEIYEVILGHEIDKRNFRKKIMSLDFVEATNQKQTGRKHRPARLYRFKDKNYTELGEPIFEAPNKTKR